MRDPVPLDPSDVPMLRTSVRHRRTSTTLVDVRGEVDLTTRTAFSDALTGAVAASNGRRVIVDLTRCTFLAACGAEALRQARSAARRRTTSLRVVVGGPAAATTARTVRLGTGLRSDHSVRAADAVRCAPRPTSGPPPVLRT